MAPCKADFRSHGLDGLMTTNDGLCFNKVMVVVIVVCLISGSVCIPAAVFVVK